MCDAEPFRKRDAGALWVQCIVQRVCVRRNHLEREMHGQAGGDGIDVHLLCNEEERKEVREEEGGCSQILCACRNKENQEVCVIVYLCMERQSPPARQ